MRKEIYHKFDLLKSRNVSLLFFEPFFFPRRVDLFEYLYAVDKLSAAGIKKTQIHALNTSIKV